MQQYRAILLVGPTGSGKTPLGKFCEQKGLWTRRCLHFDFGERLRQIETMSRPPSFLNHKDELIIRESLQTGNLLENENFQIANNILLSFIKDHGIGRDDFIILNGLPRHIGQAKDIDSIVDIDLLILLEGSTETICRRIVLNSGGDRLGRIDDSIQEIEKKLKLFQERTIPLLTHYHSKDVQIMKFPIETNTQPEEIHKLLEDKYTV